VTTFEVNIFSYQRNISSSFNSSQMSSMVLRKIVKELRGMTSPSNGSYPLVIAGTSTISFYADINGDGITNLVTYDNVGPTFDYYDSSYTGSAGSTDQAMLQPVGISTVRFVRISLPPYSDLVELRNIKTNI